MGSFTDLPGVKRKMIKSEHIRSVSEASKKLSSLRPKAGHALGTAGDEGAITVWVDDVGLFRADFQRRWINLSEIGPTKYKSHVIGWLKNWWPHMRR